MFVRAFLDLAPLFEKRQQLYRSALYGWAEKNGYSILKDRHYSFGPWRLSKSANQAVFRVTVRDERGQTRDAWVKCGGFLTGLLSEKVEVRWDSGSEVDRDGSPP